MKLTPGWQTALVFFATLGLFLAFPTADYSYDAIAYVSFIHHATFVDAASTPWNDYHILYIPFGFLLARSLVAAGFVPDVLVLMQIVNALFSALALAVFFRILRSEAGRGAPAWIGTALLGLSHAFWYYATDPEVYPPCILFMLLALLFGLRLARGGTLRDAVLCGLCQGLAIGFHVAAALLAPLLIAGCLMAKAHSGGGRAQAALRAALAGAIALAAALAPYAVKQAIRGDGSLVDALSERLVYAARQQSAEGTSWFLGRGYNPLIELRGLQTGFAPPPGEASSLPRSLPAILRGIFPLLLLVPILRWRSLVERHGAAAWIHAAWFAIFFAFFTAYNAGSLKFVAFQIIPAIHLFALSVAPDLEAGRRGTAIQAGLWLLVGLLALSNLEGVVRPGAKPENNPAILKAEFIRESTAEGDLVIHIGMGANILQKVYLPYFAGREEMVLDLQLRNARDSKSVALASLRARIVERQERGGRVFVFADVFEDPQLIARFEAKHGLPPGALGEFLGPFRPRPHARMKDGFGLYVLAPTEPGI